MAEDVPLLHRGDPVDAEHAEIVAQFTPANSGPDPPPEPDAKGADGARGFGPCVVAIAQDQAMAGVGSCFDPVEQRAGFIGKSGLVHRVDLHGLGPCPRGIGQDGEERAKHRDP